MRKMIAVLPFAALLLSGCGGGDADAEDPVIAVRKDGKKVTAGELVAAADKTEKHDRPKAEKACTALLKSFVDGGGKVDDDEAFSSACIAALAKD